MMEARIDLAGHVICDVFPVSYKFSIFTSTRNSKDVNEVIVESDL